MVSNFMVHTHPSIFLLLPRAKPLPGVVAAVPWDALHPWDAPLPCPIPRSPSPHHHCPAVGHPPSPGSRAGSARPLSPLCLTSVLGSWEEAGSQDLVAEVGISVGLREAASKQVHLRCQQGRGWMFKKGGVAVGSRGRFQSTRL